MPSHSKTDKETQIGAETGAELVIEADNDSELVAETQTDGPISDEMGADPVPETISRSVELISKLQTTAAESRRIMQRTMVFYETNKMLESSKQLKSNTLEQLRRSRK